MVFDKRTLVIPSNTTFEERTIVTKGDVIVSDRCEVHFGLLTDERIFVGENVIIQGNLIAKEDIHIDMWSRVIGDIDGKNDIYLGEKVKVDGRVKVGKDLDVGNDVKVKEFDARGWVNIRNPIPIVIYLFIYLLQLLSQGKSEQVEQILKELEEEQKSEKMKVSEIFLFIPRDSFIHPQQLRLKGNCRIGDRCRVIGNYFVSGDVKVGNETEIYGAIKSKGNVSIGRNTTVQGNVECKGKLTVDSNSKILGDVKSNSVEICKNSTINGTIHALNGVRFRNPQPKEITEKIERFERGLDDLDGVIV